MAYKKRTKTHNRKRLIFTAVLAVLLIAGYVLYGIHSRSQRQRSVTIPSTTHSGSKTGAQNSNQKSSTTGSSTNNGSGTSAANPNKSTQVGTSSGSAPIQPTGNFVSNHKPNLGGSPAPSQEQSSCNTSPGATCYIAFTKDGATKKLDAQVADSNGNVIWNWDINTAGFTSGTWQITAVATLNGQTVSGSDQLPLDVQP